MQHVGRTGSGFGRFGLMSGMYVVALLFASVTAHAQQPGVADTTGCGKVMEAVVAVAQKKARDPKTGMVNMSPSELPVPLSDVVRCNQPANGSGATSGSAASPRQPVTPAPGDTVCQVQVAPIGSVLPEAMRAQSPLDSVTFQVGAKPVKVCYGRPSARGRTMIGGASVPYGKLWRTGANEPTTIITPIPLTVAGVSVPPGIYSLYTVPGEKEWEIIINRSIAQWGIESAYTDEVKAKEVGRGKVKREALTSPVETLTIRAEPAGASASASASAKAKAGKAAALVLEWEKTRVRIPVRAK